MEEINATNEFRPSTPEEHHMNVWTQALRTTQLNVAISMRGKSFRSA